MEWLCSLAGSIKVKIMKLYLTGIKYYQLDLGMDCSAFSHARLERTLQGIKRNHREAARHIRSSLNCSHLVKLVSNLGLLDYNDTVIWVAFSLAFACFLRIGQFIYRPIDLQMEAAVYK